MKIRLLSDLHLEGCSMSPLKSIGEDLLILAGDIGNEPHLIDEFLSSYDKEFLFLAGNHEYYHRSNLFKTPQQVVSTTQARMGDKYPIETRTRLIDETYFFLGTLWTDFLLYSDQSEAIEIAELGINDFRFLTSEFMIEENSRYMKKLSNLCAQAREEGRKIVVASHFCVDPDTINSRFIGSKLNAYFYNDRRDFIRQNTDVIKVWCHGHTHSSNRSKIGETFLYCNPRGYARGKDAHQENPEFDINFIFEV